MSVYKDNKRGTFFVSTYENHDGNRVHVYKRGFKTKKEALQWEAHHDPTPPTRYPTFISLVPKWESHMQSSDGTIRQHTEHFKIRFAKYQSLPIDQFTKPVLISWRIELSDGPWSTKTKNTTISYVKGLLKFAADLYGIPDNTSVLTKLKKSNAEVMESLDKFDVWTPAEFEQFVSEVEDPVYAAFFKFLYWTGCRRGEAIALQKSCLKDGHAVIKYSQRDFTTGLTPTKTKQMRTIQLDDKLWDEISMIAESSDGPYVFGGERGLAPTTIDRVFRQAKKISGVKNIRLHDLRHSHASILINAGVNIVAVSKRLGHSTIDQTLKTYTHLLESSDQNMMLKLNVLAQESIANLSHDTKKALEIGLSAGTGI